MLLAETLPSAGAEDGLASIKGLMFLQFRLFCAVHLLLLLRIATRLLLLDGLIAALGIGRRCRFGRWTLVEIIAGRANRHNGLDGGCVMTVESLVAFQFIMTVLRTDGPALILMAGGDDSPFLVIVVFTRVVRAYNGLSTG